MVLLALLGVATIGCGGSEGPGPADAGATDAGATDAGAADATRCATSADCDDGIFCNGDERCDPSSPGADLLGCAPAAGEACMFAQICDEGMAACLTQCEAEPDADGDGHRAESCGGMDCDDADAERYPGNTEVCDAEGHDEDCDPSTYGPDADADGFVGAACCNTSADGSLLCGADCDDSSGDIRPTAPESCNGVDDNCDGLIDEGVLSTFYPDCDGDGFGALGAAPVMACVAPTSPSSACAGAMRAAWAGGATDCADGAESVHPGAAEICNGFDDDCDDAIDEGAGTPFHPDCDSDGYGAQGSIPTVACAAPAEPPPACPAGAWSDLPTDCDDAYGAVHPMAAELCNALDEDCDGAIDGPAAAIWCTLENVETETCVLGVCGVARCTSGWADCDGAAPNGCEIDLLNDPAHCGGCALPCALTNGSPACSGGSCVVGSCDAGFHECSSACVSDLALATCGIGCDPCPEPLSDGIASCDGTSCGVVCDSSSYVAVGVGTASPDCLWDLSTLSSLEPSAGILEPLFDPATTFYQVYVPLAVDTLSLIATISDPAASAVITVGAEIVSSGGASTPAALALGPNDFLVTVTAESGATLTYTVRVIRGSMPGSYIKASNTDAEDRFGSSVAMSGDTLVIGAPRESSAATGIDGNQANDSLGNSGAVYVFVRAGSTWIQQAYIKASNTGLTDQFGTSVAISGDTIVVGAPYEDSAAIGVGGDPTSNARTDSGAAYVFTRAGSTWTQQAYLKASNPDAVDHFGWSVAISADTIVVGAPREGSRWDLALQDPANNSLTQAGAAYVFARAGGSWTEQAFLKHWTSNSSGRFGESVALEADTIVVGASGRNTATVFVRAAGVWTEQAQLTVPSIDSFDRFGTSVALSGDTLVVGADGEDSAAAGVAGDPWDNTLADSGAAYVFVRVGALWSEQGYLKASDPDASDRFGHSVAIWGDSIVVGAPREDSAATGLDGDAADDSATDAGAAYRYVRAAGVWSLEAYLKASNTDPSDRFGAAVCVWDRSVAVAATDEASLATGVGGTEGNGANRCGAVYTFE